MTMQSASRWRTVCEIFRKINDAVQSDTPKDAEIRKLCDEGMRKAKVLAKHLSKYENTTNWWEPNVTYKKDIERRFKEGYKSC